MAEPYSTGKLEKISREEKEMEEILGLEGLIGHWPERERAGIVTQGAKISGKGFTGWSQLVHLQELDLSYSRDVDDHELKNLGQLKNLESLNLSGTDINGDCFKYLKKFNSVKKLFLFDCRKLEDKGLKHLKNLPNLEEVHISNAPELTGEAFKEWKGLKNLRWLEVTSCPGLIEKYLRYLNDLTYLKRLNLSGRSYR